MMHVIVLTIYLIKDNASTTYLLYSCCSNKHKSILKDLP